MNEKIIQEYIASLHRMIVILNERMDDLSIRVSILSKILYENKKRGN